MKNMHFHEILQNIIHRQFVKIFGLYQYISIKILSFVACQTSTMVNQ